MRPAGFTLIELLIVVVVIAIAAAVAIPSLGRLGGGQAESSARDLAYAIRYAQSRAMSTQTEMRLVLDEKNFWLEEAGLDDKTAFRRITGRMGVSQALDPDLQIEGFVEPLVVHADGTISPAAFRLCHGRCMIVSTEEQIGQVSVYEDEA